MPIYQKKKAENALSSKKVVGAYLPLQLIEFMVMYAMCNNTSSSVIVEGLLNNWKFEQEKSEHTREALVKLLGTKAFEIFKTSKKGKPEFIRELELELKGKKLNPETIELIIKEFNYAAEK